MRWNPVFRREMTVGSRSIRMMAILFVFNSILAAVALFNMYSVAEQVRTTAEIQYSQFLDLYTFVSSIEFIMLLFIMPALTASSISGERERQTLELMLTTTMEPRDMVLGCWCWRSRRFRYRRSYLSTGALRCRTSGCCSCATALWQF